MNVCPMTPYFLAAFCDSEFKNGLRGINETETNARLKAIIDLFRLLNSRDIFVKSYTKYLAARLINNTFLSLDLEELMISKLKVECGHNTVNKLALMIADLKTSKELMLLFRESPASKQIASEGVDFSADVLTSGHWPE